MRLPVNRYATIAATVFLAFAAIFASLPQQTAAADEPPMKKPPMNVIFLLVDDWGWTDAGCFGSDLYETPHIDRLAESGVRFTQAYAACTVCSPTRASVMTGMNPARTRVTDWIAGHSYKYVNKPVNIPDWVQRLEHSRVTIAEALRADGYRTAHIGKWHLTPTENEIEQRLYWPEHHGFELNVAGNRWGLPGSYFWPYQRESRWATEMWNMPPGKKGDYLTDELTDEAIKIVDYFQDQPFFLYLPYYAVHSPIEGKPSLAKEFANKVESGLRHQNAEYAAMVASVDASVGRILDKLDKLGISDRTAIFLTGDNGGLDNGRGQPTENAPLRAGKGSAYEGGVRVPGVARIPGVTPSGATCDEPIISYDFYPTILELTGVAGDGAHNRNLDGVSLMPVLKDPSGSLDRDSLVWHYPHYHPGGAVPHSAIRHDGYRLVEFHTDGHVELYNLNDDIGESNDLADVQSGRAEQMRDELHAYLSSVDAQMPTPNPQYDADQPSGWPGKLK